MSEFGCTRPTETWRQVLDQALCEISCGGFVVDRLRYRHSNVQRFSPTAEIDLSLKGQRPPLYFCRIFAHDTNATRITLRQGNFLLNIKLQSVNGKLRESGRRKVIGLPGSRPTTAGLPDNAS